MFEKKHPRYSQDTKHREYILRRMIEPQEAKLTMWGESILRTYGQVVKLSSIPVISLTKKSEWIVLGSRIYNKLDDEAKLKSHLIMSARDVNRCNVFPRSFTYDLKSYAAITTLIQGNSEAAYVKFKERIQKILKKTEAIAIIANSTIDPINRAWIESGKALGLKTLCLQHGVYSNGIPDYALEEDIVDTYISLDEGQESILSRSIDPAKILNLGCQKKFTWIVPPNSPNICFVGEDWERYGLESVKSLIIKRYIKIIHFLRGFGYENFFYKSHPSETDLMGISKYASLIQKQNNGQMDVFIGFSSSLLRDMSSKGKLGIQILDPITKAENFQDLGYCLSINNGDEMLEGLLRMLTSPSDTPFIYEPELSAILKKIL